MSDENELERLIRLRAQTRAEDITEEAAKWFKRTLFGSSRVSSDDLRKVLDAALIDETERQVVRIRNAIIRLAIREIEKEDIDSPKSNQRICG